MLEETNEDNRLHQEKERQKAVKAYINNCQKYGVDVDPSVVVSLLTGWNKLQPSSQFGEGSMLPLLGILDSNEDIVDVKLTNSKYHPAGYGNSNTRVLSQVLKFNTSIRKLDMSHMGLDDEGIDELCKGIIENNSITELNLASNQFGELGAAKLLDALNKNSSIKKVNLSMNALGFRSINSLLCACRPKGIALTTDGNYVFEEILNSVSHGVAFLLSVVAAIVLISDVVDPKFTDYHFWSCVLYSFSLMFLFLSSCLFHSFFMMPTHSRVLQILDHIGIYMLIAGSYTPFFLIGLHHDMPSRVLLSAEWLCAIFGSVFSASSDFNNKFTTYVELSLFLIMGLGVVFVWPAVVNSISYHAILLLLLGGGAYIFGIIFFILGEVKPIYHCVWHFFVILGATLHWFDVYFFIVNIELGQQAVASFESASENIIETVGNFIK